MSSPETFDIAGLLAPIPGDQPTGADLREDASAGSLYYLIRDARSAARTAERQAGMVGEGETERPDWRPVLRHSQQALAARTKDLEVVAYLIEALVRLHGFAGLRDGWRLARGLVEQFWDGLYPWPDEDGLATRVAPLTSLNGDDAEGTLIVPIGQVLITAGQSAGPFATFHYQQAAALEQVDEEAKAKRVAAGAVPLAAIHRAVAETPAAFFVDLVDDLTRCREELAALSQALDERCGRAAPPASSLRGALAVCLDAVHTIARDKLASAAAAAGGAGAETARNGEGTPLGKGTAGGGQAATGVIRDREDAFQTLLKVADFFRRTEPHTPVSYALEQAVRWGRMALPELLAELIPDEQPRVTLFKQVGIRPPPGT